MKPLLCRIANGITMFFEWVLSFIDSLFNKHKLVRRSIVASVMIMIGWTVYVIIPKLDGAHAVTALGLVIGVLTPVIALYKWSRDKDK